MTCSLRVAFGYSLNTEWSVLAIPEAILAFSASRLDCYYRPCISRPLRPFAALHIQGAPFGSPLSHRETNQIRIRIPYSVHRSMTVHCYLLTRVGLRIGAEIELKKRCVSL